MYRITCVAGAPPQINISTVKGNAVTSQRHKYTETTGSVTTNRKCLNLIWNLCNWVWRQQQWLLLVYKAVTGQFPAILAEDYTQPCLEQELEHCSAFCQEKTCTAALKLNWCSKTDIYNCLYIQKQRLPTGLWDWKTCTPNLHIKDLRHSAHQN